MESKIKMPVLKKTLQTLKRSIHLLIFINLICSATTFSLLYFAGRKIQTYVLMIYAYAPQLQDLQNVLSENLNVADLDKLNESLAVINQAYNMILLITIVSLILFFILVCFFQSLEWGITYKSLKKAVKLEGIFDNYLKYSLKFSLITLPAFIIILPSAYYFIANIKSLFLNLIMRMYGLTETSATINYVSLIVLFLLILITTYITVITYILLNKHSLKEAIKKAFKTGVKKIKILLPIHFISITIIIPIIYIDIYITKILDFKIAAILSLLIYFTLIAYYQVLMNVLLEKE